MTQKQKFIIAFVSSLLFISLVTNVHVFNENQDMLGKYRELRFEKESLEYQFNICKFLLRQ